MKEAHLATAQSMALRVVELYFQGLEAGEPIVRYKVMNQLVGFVNDFHNIQQRANAVLTWNPDRPLGQHSLMLKLINHVAAEQEILINYWPNHCFGKFGKRTKAFQGAARKKKLRTSNAAQIAPEGKTLPEG